MKKTAVITDATSPGFFFPRWRRYYGKLFGLQNLHVVTYAGMKAQFQAFGLGNVWEINHGYDDPLRAQVISDFVALLLNTYDVVLRCDVDEFLVPDPARAFDLAEFIKHNNMPYVTSLGVDVIELADDPPLDADAPVLGVQRRYGLRAGALSKTGLTTVPLRWAAGFHATNKFPRFGGLYNFHLKFADLKGRLVWHELMLAGVSPGTKEHAYFGVGAEHLTQLQEFLATRPKSGPESEAEFESRFLNTVTYNRTTHIYQGSFINQDHLFSIEEAFGGFPGGF